MSHSDPRRSSGQLFGRVAASALAATLLMITLPFPGELIRKVAAAGPTFIGLTPARLMDTRAGGATVDGQARGAGAIGPNATTSVVVVGRGGVPASNVNSVALNVTATGATSASYLTVFPTGAARPEASSLNFSAGQTIPNMVIAQVGAGGSISLFNSAGSTNLLVDVLGYFPTGGGFTSLVPGRLMDTRSGGVTVDNQFARAGALGPTAVRNVTVIGRGGVPGSGAGSVVLNVTATAPTATSFLTVYPAGAARPTASNLNLTPGATVPNLVVVPVGVGGQASIYNDAGNTDVLVDVVGWFPISGSTFTAITPYRIEDTRDWRGLLSRGVTGVDATGAGGVPAAGVSAVILNVTAVDPSSSSFMTAWPSGAPRPNASNLNYVDGQTIPNMVIVPVTPDGLAMFYNEAGQTDLIVDVLGYFLGTPFSLPPAGPFTCTTRLKNSLLTHLATNQSGAYTYWAWDLLDGDGGELTVHMWNPATGQLVISAFNEYGDGQTVAYVNRTKVGALIFADGWVFEDVGDASLIYRSWWNSTRDVYIAWAAGVPGSGGFPVMSSCS